MGSSVFFVLGFAFFLAKSSLFLLLLLKTCKGRFVAVVISQTKPLYVQVLESFISLQVFVLLILDFDLVDRSNIINDDINHI